MMLILKDLIYYKGKKQGVQCYIYIVHVTHNYHV